MQPDNPNYLSAALFGFAAASIWASWSAITRLAVTTSVDAWDIAALRYGVAGIILSPVLMQRGLALDRLGWLGLIVIIAGGGAPYALVAANGLHFAPAGDQAALNPGCVPLFVALIAAIVLGEKVSTPRKFGLSLILTGALIIIGWRTETWSTSRAYGHALSLSAAFLWACFTVIMLQAKLDPLHAAALVSTGSLGDLPAHLPGNIRNATGTDTARRHHNSSDVPGRSRDHRFPSSLWPCGCRAGRFGWCLLWSFGAGAVGAHCDTSPQGVAKPSGLPRHRPDLCRCLSGKRRTVAAVSTTLSHQIRRSVSSVANSASKRSLKTKRLRVLEFRGIDAF
jgi:hypothetical protein